MMPEAAAADWSELPGDLLELILTRLDSVHDHCRYSCVCLSWRSAAVDNRCRDVPLNQFPGLLMRQPVEITCGCPLGIVWNKFNCDAGDDEDRVTPEYGLTCSCRKNIRHFTQLNYRTGLFGESSFSNIDDDVQQQQHEIILVPHGQSNLCIGSAYGWLFLIDEDLSVKLFNPFSRAEIQLPSAETLPRLEEDDTAPFVKWNLKKAVFSSNPSFSHPPPLIVAIFADNMEMLVFCKPGEKTWTPLPLPTDMYPCYTDVIYFKDQFYTLGNRFSPCIVAYRVSRTDSTAQMTLVATWPSAPHTFRYSHDIWHLVEFDKELAIVIRGRGYDADVAQHVEIDHQEAALTRVNRTHGDADRTIGFQIFRIEMNGEDKKLVEVNNLGDNTMFLGLNTSYCLRASDHPGCIPNSIYFTDAYAETALDGDPDEDYVGYDMGIYKLENKKVEPLHDVNAPSTCWLTYFPPW